jgi:hypothetical protein
MGLDVLSRGRMSLQGLVADPPFSFGAIITAQNWWKKSLAFSFSSFPLWEACQNRPSSSLLLVNLAWDGNGSPASNKAIRSGSDNTKTSWSIIDWCHVEIFGQVNDFCFAQVR